MALEDSDWRKIYAAIADAQSPSIVVQGKVIRNDTLNNLVWLKEFGDQPIPLFMFDFTVKYYDTQPTTLDVDGVTVHSKVVVKKTKVIDVKVTCPKVGETVLVLKQHGSRRLPKCIGVLRSHNYLITESGE